MGTLDQEMIDSADQDAPMKTEPNGEPEEVDFLVFSLELIEHRIAQLDNKASVLLGLATALAIAVNVAVPFEVLSRRHILFGLGVGVAYAAIAAVALLALMVIRPSRTLTQPSDTALWFAPGRNRKITSSDHLLVLHGPNGTAGDRVRLKSLRESHRKLLESVTRKFYWYHWTATAMKVLVVYLAALGAAVIAIEIFG